jgi:hypothetical protein
MSRWHLILASVLCIAIGGHFQVYALLYKQHGRALLSAAAAMEAKAVVSPTWVFLALYSGDDESARRAEATWFKGDIGRVAFGVYKSADVECRSRWKQASTFENVRRAFLHAATCYPTAKFFARFNVHSQVDRVQLMQRVGEVDYFGIPVQSGGLVFASAADGYVLSLKAVRQLAFCNASTDNEDAGIGECLRDAGIRLSVVSGQK